jgi:nitrite reductase/ring-hydroxylating ferredoxin subunit
VSDTFVCQADEMPDRAARSFDLGRVRVCLVRAGDRFYALHDRCPHRMAPLSAGTVGGTAVPSEVGVVRYGRDGEILRCPWHGWEFDVTDGRSLHDPVKERVRAYPVEIVEGAVYVDLAGRAGDSRGKTRQRSES